MAIVMGYYRVVRSAMKCTADTALQAFVVYDKHLPSKWLAQLAV